MDRRWAGGTLAVGATALALALPVVGAVLLPTAVFAALVVPFARRPDETRGPRLSPSLPALPSWVGLSTTAGRAVVGLWVVGTMELALVVFFDGGVRPETVPWLLPGLTYLVLAVLALVPPALGRPVSIGRSLLVAGLLALGATAVFDAVLGIGAEPRVVVALAAVCTATMSLFPLGVAVGSGARNRVQKLAIGTVGAFALAALSLTVGTAANPGTAGLVLVVLIAPVTLVGTPPYLLGRALGRY